MSAQYIDKLIFQSDSTLVQGFIFLFWSWLSQCVTPHNHEPACACEEITTENRFQVPSDVFTLTEYKVLVCLNLLKNEASQNIISPVWRPGTWVALMVCYAGRTDLERKWLFCQALSCSTKVLLHRHTKKEIKRTNVYSSEIHHSNVLMRLPLSEVECLYLIFSLFTFSKPIIFCLLLLLLFFFSSGQ